MEPTAGLTDHVTPVLDELPVTVAVNCWVSELVRETDAGETVTVTFCPCPTATPCNSSVTASRPGTDMARPERVGRTGRREPIAVEVALVNVSCIVMYPKAWLLYRPSRIDIPLQKSLTR